MISCNDKLIISEKSKWKGVFDILMLFLAVYSTFTSAYNAAFGKTESVS
jgi:hypothetical protein